jgi:hypothetical protein
MAGFTPEDMSDPFVASLTGQDVCQRSGPLTGQYWLDLGRAATGWIKSVAPH